jgi:hypothetical protein
MTQDLAIGLHLRLLTPWMKFPAGTLATVDTVDTLRRGEASAYFTVRWLGLPPGTSKKPRNDQSLRFCEEDLHLFEVVSDLDEAIAHASGSVYWRHEKRDKKSGTDTPLHGLKQMRLPFSEDNALAVFTRLP